MKGRGGRGKCLNHIEIDKHLCKTDIIFFIIPIGFIPCGTPFFIHKLDIVLFRDKPERRELLVLSFLIGLCSFQNEGNGNYTKESTK